MVGIIRRRRIFWFGIFISSLIITFYWWSKNIHNLRQPIRSVPLFVSTTPQAENEYDREPEDIPEPLYRTTPDDYDHLELEFSDPIEIKDGQFMDGKIPMDDITLSDLESQIKWNSSEFRFKQLTLPNPIIEHMKDPMAFHLESKKSKVGTTNKMGFDDNPFVGKGDNSGLIIDTAGCQIQQFDPMDPTIVDLYNKTTGKYPCFGDKSFLIVGDKSSILVNETDLSISYNRKKVDLNCYYQSIERTSQEEENYNREENVKLSKPQSLQFGTSLTEDYVFVTCKIASNGSMENKTVYHYFPLVHIKEKIENVKKLVPPPSPHLNIIIAGIDSISRLNFLRHFPNTKHFLEEKMSAFDMMGYAKVGDNTFPNLVPLLTGHHVNYYYNESLMNTTYFDHLDFIWKEFSDKGYRTFFAEDHPVAGTFNYNKRGFKDPPTDYYYRPIALAMDDTKIELNKGSKCLNSESDTDMIYDFLKNFIKVMDNRPFFTFTMVSTMTHGILNNAGYQDEPTYALLEDLWNKGTLNKSMLVLFSDHGIRYGEIRQRYIGKFEERLPFMYIYFPDWFLNAHPPIAENLRTNQKRLITLFDVHATLLHVLNLTQQSLPNPKESEGLSLLDEVTSERTCKDALIPSHFCPCQTFQQIPTIDEKAVTAFHAAVDSMNDQLQDHKQCAFLRLHIAMDVWLGKANDGNFLNYKYADWKNSDILATVYEGQVHPLIDYLVTFQTKPGKGVFEGTVRHYSKNNTFVVLGISRINKYGTQSHCIDSPKLKLYCYCRR